MTESLWVAWSAGLRARLAGLADGEPLAVQPVVDGPVALVPSPPRRRWFRTVDPGPRWPFVQFARRDHHLLQEVVWSTEPTGRRPATAADEAALSSLGWRPGRAPTVRSTYLTLVRWWPEEEPRVPFPDDVDLTGAVALTIATLRGPIGVRTPADVVIDPA